MTTEHVLLTAGEIVLGRGLLPHLLLLSSLAQYVPLSGFRRIVGGHYAA